MTGRIAELPDGVHLADWDGDEAVFDVRWTLVVKTTRDGETRTWVKAAIFGASPEPIGRLTYGVGTGYRIEGDAAQVLADGIETWLEENQPEGDE